MSKIFENLNHRKPLKSFSLHIKFLYFLGLWPPQLYGSSTRTNDRKTNYMGIMKEKPRDGNYYWKNKMKYLIYKIYSFIFRFGFLYFYTFTQVMFFRDVRSLKDIADALFVLMTQFSLIYKVFIFDQNQIKIRKLVEFLETNTCLAAIDEEEEFIRTAMKRTIISFLSFFIPAQLTIFAWAIFPLIDEAEIRLPLPAWYPFDIKSNWVFALMYIYQIFGIYVSSWYNVSIETFLSGLLAHGTAQVDRLGYQLSQLGHKNCGKETIKMENITRVSCKHVNKDDETHIYYIDDTKYRNSSISVHNELKKFIVFHKIIIRYISDVEEIFHNTIFAQLFSSVIIICMTGIQLIGTPINSVKFFSMALYLITMIAEISSFCWMGNELIYSSTKLTENAYFSNFTEFDRISKKTLIFIMLRTLHREISFKAGNILRVTLSLPTLLNIIKTSYSYFAVLKTIQDQE